MRLFIQIPVSDYVKEQAKDIQEKFEDLGVIKFVEPENFHFNLKFLGETDKLEEIKEKLSEIKNPEFNLHVNGVGVFPNIQYIKVLWLGVENAREITSLHQKIEDSMTEIGLKEHDHDMYVPHMTLGRVKNVNDEEKDRMVNLVKGLEDIDVGNYEANKFQLMKSELKSDGPVYTVLEEYELD